MTQFIIKILPILACCFAVSCSQQQKHDAIPIGVIANIETGVVVSVKKIKINVKKAEDGTFAAMAGSAAQAVSPGFLSEGTSRIASATGSLMDNKVDLEEAVRVRVKLDENKKLVEIIQLERPNLTFKLGQKVFISKGSTPGNLWID